MWGEVGTPWQSSMLTTTLGNCSTTQGWDNCVRNNDIQGYPLHFIAELGLEPVAPHSKLKLPCESVHAVKRSNNYVKTKQMLE